MCELQLLLRERPPAGFSMKVKYACMVSCSYNAIFLLHITFEKLSKKYISANLQLPRRYAK